MLFGFPLVISKSIIYSERISYHISIAQIRYNGTAYASGLGEVLKKGDELQSNEPEGMGCKHNCSRNFLQQNKKSFFRFTHFIFLF